MRFSLVSFHLQFFGVNASIPMFCKWHLSVVLLKSLEFLGKKQQKNIYPPVNKDGGTFMTSFHWCISHKDPVFFGRIWPYFRTYVPYICHLVGGFDPSEKYEFVSWDDDIPKIWKVIKFMFQTTNQIYLQNISYIIIYPYRNIFLHIPMYSVVLYHLSG